MTPYHAGALLSSPLGTSTWWIGGTSHPCKTWSEASDCTKARWATWRLPTVLLVTAKLCDEVFDAHHGNVITWSYPVTSYSLLPAQPAQFLNIERLLNDVRGVLGRVTWHRCRREATLSPILPHVWRPTLIRIRQ